MIEQLEGQRDPLPFKKVAVLIFLLLILLSACTSPLRGLSPSGEPPAGQHPWAAALRALDPSDTTDPAQDITAVYLRQTEAGLQVRVDLLDFQSTQELSLDITLSSGSAPETTSLSIHIPSVDIPFHTSLDPLLATVVVDVPLSAIPSRPQVDVSTREEQVTGLRLDGPMPAQTVPLLLTFYDTFAARFPAEALRRWDGAHTGPRGDRHGLKHLLDAGEEYDIPIVLLDLKELKNLSALDAMGALPRIQQMEQKGLLILPDQAEHDPLFGFSPSRFSWGERVSHHTFVFLNDPNHSYRPLFSKNSFLPVVKESDTNQPTWDGPSLEVRRALLETALNPDGEDLLGLGGSLRDSTWGSPDMVAPTLAYFASRPYIHVLAAKDLANFPAKAGKPELQSLPADEPFHTLERHYQNLTQPVLEFVAHWKGSPLSHCETDLDKDNQPECVLANHEYLAILDPQGARLTYFFAVEQDSSSFSLQQLIGPSWQVAVGLSNPSLWDLPAGEAADPGAYPGAFADADGPFKPYEPAVEGTSITFRSMDGARLKIFTLDETGLQVEYRTREPVRTQIPLLVEPLTRVTPGWARRYVQKKTPGGITWGLVDGPAVSVLAQDAAPSSLEEPVTLHAFNESLSLLAGPEDPDFDYPPGHYVPFPMAIAEVEIQDGYFLRLERLP